MKIKNVNLEWYAFTYSWSSHKLVHINVLYGRKEEIAKKVRKGKKDGWKPVYNYETFKDYIKGELMYRYWCKAEHEVMIYDLYDADGKRGEKHDIWWQLEPNLDRICEYIIHEMNIDFKTKNNEV